MERTTKKTDGSDKRLGAALIGFALYVNVPFALLAAARAPRPAAVVAGLVLALTAAMVAASPVRAQESDTNGPRRELIVHGFRSPSIGLEYRRDRLGLHAGFYPTILSGGEGSDRDTTWFAKAGATFYPRPLAVRARRGGEPFLSVAYVRGLNRGRGDGGFFEAGYRFAGVLGRGVDLRLGAGVLSAAGGPTRVNPTIGIGWSLPLR